MNAKNLTTKKRFAIKNTERKASACEHIQYERQFVWIIYFDHTNRETLLINLKPFKWIIEEMSKARLMDFSFRYFILIQIHVRYLTADWWLDISAGLTLGRNGDMNWHLEWIKNDSFRTFGKSIAFLCSLLRIQKNFRHHHTYSHLEFEIVTYPCISDIFRWYQEIISFDKVRQNYLCWRPNRPTTSNSGWRRLTSILIRFYLPYSAARVFLLSITWKVSMKKKVHSVLFMFYINIFSFCILRE